MKADEQFLQNSNRPISPEKKMECYACFKEGYGYKKTATITGLKLYTVRDYKRRFVQGDYTWLGTQNDQDTTGSLF